MTKYVEHQTSKISEGYLVPETKRSLVLDSDYVHVSDGIAAEPDTFIRLSEVPKNTKRFGVTETKRSL